MYLSELADRCDVCFLLVLNLTWLSELADRCDVYFLHMFCVVGVREMCS